MSLIVAFQVPSEIIICSDGLGVRIEDDYLTTYSGAKKMLCLPNKKVIFAYSGVNSIGKLAFQFVSANFSKDECLDTILRKCAAHIKGLNKGFTGTESAKSFSDKGFTPLTGVLLAGYVNTQKLFALILPTGDTVFPKRFAVLGYTADWASQFIKNKSPNFSSRENALTLGKEVIQKAAEASFSNRETFCLSVSNKNILELLKGD